jgi:peptidoglycan hydrolase-like protein with peptidoglycan-binding domain
MMNENLWTIAKPEAARLKMEAAVLMAVMEVESGGRYFANIDGKQEPLIRFEGHYFDKRLSPPSRARARLRKLASPVAGAIANPNRQADRWALLRKAMAIDTEAALESTSWGIGQVMGAHWKWLDFASVDALTQRARQGIEGQVDLMMRYIEKANLVDALRDKNWSAFARGYNGPAYAKQNYHIKLAKAYERLTESEPEIATETPPAKTALKLGDKGNEVRDLQQMMTTVGHAVAITGTFDAATENALKAFQRRFSLEPDGLFGPETARLLSQQLPKLDGWQRMIAWAKQRMGMET